MSVEKVADQVRGIFGREKVPFSESDDGAGFQVLSGSTGAFIQLYSWVDKTVVEIYSWVLSDVDSSGDRLLKTLQVINDWNRGSRFGTLWLDPEKGVIVLEHHILGDELDASELMNALDGVIFRADNLDDELIKELGTGRSWEEVAKEAAGQPTIST